jgi:predicted AAA+ superfamily ATPase
MRFLPIAASMHRQEINTSGIARDAAVARSTVDGYLTILEDTLLTLKPGAYTPRLRIRERRRSKLYWVDPGVVRALKRQFGPFAPKERESLFE